MSNRAKTNQQSITNLRSGLSIGQLILRHFIDSTAILMAVTPIYMFIELVVWRFNPQVSLNARLVIIGMTYLGTGFLIAKGRDFSKHFFAVDQPNTPEKRILIHDLLYLVGFNAVFAPIIYFISRANLTELLLGTLSAMTLSIITGPINGYFIDAVGELTGIRQSTRLPYKVQLLRQSTKLGLFFTSLFLLILIVSLIYGGLIH